MKNRLCACLAAFGTACFAMLVLNSCKEDTLLGSNVIPVDDDANSVAIEDTLTILTRTVVDDTIITSYSFAGVPIYHALGAVAADPVAGRTQAGFYLQVVPPSLGYAFPKTPDSAYLVLPYAGFTWGDTTVANMTQEIRVFEVAGTDSIVRDSFYYNYSKTAHDALPIGSAAVGFNSGAGHQRIRDSVTVLGQKRAPHLRIKLSQAFLQKFITEAGKSSGSAMGGYAEFLSFQRGLYITTADSMVGNALYYFVLNGSTDWTRANIQFYYTEPKEGGGDTVKYASFPFDQTRNAHYNRIRRNFSGSYTASLLASANSSDSVTVLQNEPGAMMDIRIPHIKNLPRQPIIKAELIITQAKLPGDAAEVYFPPARLYPVRVTDTGAAAIQDRFPVSSLEPLNFMDGLRKDVTINGTTYSQYVINIPREVQRAIAEQRDTLHLRISGAATFPGAYRLVAAGRRAPNSAEGLKLRIFYSKL